MIKVGILTSGGDCQALNPAIYSVCRALFNSGREVKIFGFLDGYRGLMYNRYINITEETLDGLMFEGGTVLGTSRTPFKQLDRPDENGTQKVGAMKETYEKLKLDCLVILGGNGTSKTAERLSREGLNVVAMPKTIDNDVWGTDVSFGFWSAVDAAQEAVMRIRTTAKSHGRVFFVEIMGHKVGWLALYAGMAAGADAILIPEIPYDIKKIADSIKNKKYAVIAVAEGALSKEEAALDKKERKAYLKSAPSSAVRAAAKLKELTDKETYATVLGHTQRGGAPCAYDRVLTSRLGAAAAELVLNKDYGNMVIYKNTEITKLALCEVAGKLKTVEEESSIIAEAKSLGICFGN
ncbi:MAG: ATP-dependent 6-phosphofructokinase [Clostridiales bacterium]|nr:ATP-dependent 6-phosphofructokinase [Clostridiales bacterium]